MSYLGEKELLGKQFQTSIHQQGLPTVITNTNAVTGNFYAVYAMEATVIATITVNQSSGSGAVTSVTLAAGQMWYIPFTSITLTSGKVTCYSGDNRIES